MACFVYDEKNCANTQKADIGGKARNLFHLQQSGLPVPEFVCVSAEVFKLSISHIHHRINTLLDDCDFDNVDSLVSCSESIKPLVLACDFPPQAKQQLLDSLSSLGCFGAFSVRSSASNEDGNVNSFAGQLGTWLNVDLDNIESIIKKCWASAFEPGVLAYLNKINKDPMDNLVSVIVQRMVVSKSSGVMFQADPQSGINYEAIVAGYGLGEGVVSDKVETDLYLYDKLNKTWKLSINEKERRLDCHINGGLEEVEIPADEKNAPVLNEFQRELLISTSNKISELYDHFQDVEWAFDQQGKLYVLQSRPITTIPKGYDRIFDNSNIIESYPGVVLPMTFSILHLDYYHCVKDCLKLLGSPGSVLRKYDDNLAHLVGYINGRSYYNISNWYKTLLILPFFRKKIIAYFEQMIGTDGSFQQQLDEKRLTTFERLKISFMFPLAFIYHLKNHDRLISRYFELTKKMRDEVEDMDFENSSSDEIIGNLRQYTRRFMKSLSIPIMNDFFAMIFMSITRGEFIKTGVSDAESILNGLLANQNIESTKPVRSLEKIIDRVKNDKKAFVAIQETLKSNNNLASISEALKSGGFDELAVMIEDHVRLYGHRSPKELIMEVETFKENPFQLLRMVVASAQVDKAEKKDNSAYITDKYQEILSKYRFPKILQWLLEKTRKSIAHREATRLDRGLHFSFFRLMLRHIGNKMVEEGVLSHFSDVFYLTLDELDDFRRGCSPNNDLKGLVKYRRAQAESWDSVAQEGKIFTSGAVYANKIPDIPVDLDSTDGFLYGTGCSDGEITAKARIVRNPNGQSDVKGKIMISETTDPGWVFLMTISAGLISERGSLLSHTAIIGRELGIPTIVGVKHATNYIQDDQEISMNGKSGKIDIRN